jgi:prepilin-type N-terminal cleavage/methylation domain-containing protein
MGLHFFNSRNFSLRLRHIATAGFTLVEMLIVVAVLGILVAIAVPALNSSKETAKQNALKGAARTLSDASNRVRLKAESPADYANVVLQPGMGSGWTASGGESLQTKRDAVSWLLDRGYITIKELDGAPLEDLVFNPADQPGGWRPK